MAHGALQSCNHMLVYTALALAAIICPVWRPNFLVLSPSMEPQKTSNSLTLLAVGAQDSSSNSANSQKMQSMMMALNDMMAAQAAAKSAPSVYSSMMIDGGGVDKMQTMATQLGELVNGMTCESAEGTGLCISGHSSMCIVVGLLPAVSAGCDVCCVQRICDSHNSHGVCISRELNVAEIRRAISEASRAGTSSSSSFVAAPFDQSAAASTGTMLSIMQQMMQMMSSLVSSSTTATTAAPILAEDTTAHAAVVHPEQPQQQQPITSLTARRGVIASDRLLSLADNNNTAASLATTGLKRRANSTLPQRTKPSPKRKAKPPPRKHQRRHFSDVVLTAANSAEEEEEERHDDRPQLSAAEESLSFALHSLLYGQPTTTALSQQRNASSVLLDLDKHEQILTPENVDSEHDYVDADYTSSSTTISPAVVVPRLSRKYEPENVFPSDAEQIRALMHSVTHPKPRPRSDDDDVVSTKHAEPTATILAHVLQMLVLMLNMNRVKCQIMGGHVIDDTSCPSRLCCSWNARSCATCGHKNEYGYVGGGVRRRGVEPRILRSSQRVRRSTSTRRQGKTEYSAAVSLTASVFEPPTTSNKVPGHTLYSPYQYSIYDTDTERFNIFKRLPVDAVDTAATTTGVGVLQYGHQYTSPGEWCWQAALISTNDFGFLCGAVLIHRRWALTTAHCVKHLLARDLVVRLGAYYMSTLSSAPSSSLEAEYYSSSSFSPKSSFTANDSDDYFEFQQDIVVAKIHVHEQFNAHNYDNNIALLELVEDALCRHKSICTVCWEFAPTSAEEPAGNLMTTKCTATGWGSYTDGGAALSPKMKAVELSLQDDAVCEQSYRNLPGVSGSFKLPVGARCARSLYGMDTCKYDGGGPLVCPYHDTYFLYGLTSLGVGCDRQPFLKVPSIYTNVLNYTEWIRWHVYGLDKRKLAKAGSPNDNSNIIQLTLQHLVKTKMLSR